MPFNFDVSPKNGQKPLESDEEHKRSPSTSLPPPTLGRQKRQHLSLARMAMAHQPQRHHYGAFH